MLRAAWDTPAVLDMHGETRLAANHEAASRSMLPALPRDDKLSELKPPQPPCHPSTVAAAKTQSFFHTPSYDCGHESSRWASRHA